MWCATLFNNLGCKLDTIQAFSEYSLKIAVYEKFILIMEDGDTIKIFKE